MTGAVTLGQIEVSLGVASVIDYEWPIDLHYLDCSPVHQIALSLSPVPRGSHGRFWAPGCHDESVGKLVYLPSNVPLEASNEGGFQRVSSIGFTEAAFAKLTGHARPWSATQLARGMDIRSSRMAGAMHRISQEIMKPGFASQIVVESLMMIFGVDLARYLNDGRSDKAALIRGGLPARALTRIEDRIGAEDQIPPSVDELAALARLSPRHLLRTYQEATGESLRERLQREANARAKTWLRDTDMPLKLIAARLGFQSQGSFSTAFARANGETPRRYRAKTA